MKRYQQSIFDFLVDKFNNPPTKNGVQDKYVNGKAADKLFQVWKNKQNKISNRIYHRPSTVSLEDVNEMQKAGLVRNLGEQIELTGKGENVIRVMILGDDNSIFEKNSKQISYVEAMSNTKSRSLKNSKKKNEDSWWDQVLRNF